MKSVNDTNARIQVVFSRDVTFPNGSVRPYSDAIMFAPGEILTPTQANNLIAAAKDHVVGVIRDRITNWKAVQIAMEESNPGPPTTEQRWRHLSDNELREIKAYMATRGI